MEKLYNCEILDKNINYNNIEKSLIKKNKNFIYDSSASLLDELYFDYYKDGINYTELYKKFKEDNCVKSYNRLPVCAYKYPQNTKIGKFDKLKRELIYDKINNESGEKKNKVDYYNSDLKIFVPNKLKNDNGKKEKKSLRKKIYDGEVMFYEDYLEQVAARDYQYFFKKPYKIKRKDEGGKYYFYGRKIEMNEDEDLYRKYYGYDDEYFLKKMQLNEKSKKKVGNNLKKKKEKEEESLEKEYEKLNHKDKNFILKIKEENEIKNLNIYNFYTKNKNIIFDKNLSEIKKKELLNGYIPDIIFPVNNRKTKHPKNCTVLFSRLNTYAKFLEDLLICPYIHNAIDAELGKYWKTNENDNIKKLKTEKIKKGYKKDIYSVTKEQLEKSNEKLKNLLEKEKENDKNLKVSLNFKIQKEERESKSICNGRYMI
ncbi:conserved Plasmodium protein, unknown function [Plasmodium gallinaceum]|uniref:Apical exonemal protein n=1 Tax=Plasmodium gallinaceum TaxID=5849 RepID=A0A1J1GV72_PLAGA|nr:conserved Plasmodium protein, unknown function [Plasmodium gallinaceum]CRG96423.1 conserved Plasmodium protein, unknown function [Plasmodium gallinaceum]